MDAWNKVLRERGIDVVLRVPHKAFNRQIGHLASVRVDPTGNLVSEADWQEHVGDWLPTDEDSAFVQSLMGRVVERGGFASWIAPPSSGINGQPVDCQYVRFN